MPVSFTQVTVVLFHLTQLMLKYQEEHHFFFLVYNSCHINMSPLKYTFLVFFSLMLAINVVNYLCDDLLTVCFYH